MTKKRKVINAKADKDGDITHVLIQGNTNYTPVDAAMRMADRNELSNAHSVRGNPNAKDYLRTNPDSQKGNNLDTWAGDE